MDPTTALALAGVNAPTVGLLVYLLTTARQLKISLARTNRAIILLARKMDAHDAELELLVGGDDHADAA